MGERKQYRCSADRVCSVRRARSRWARSTRRRAWRDTPPSPASRTASSSCSPAQASVTSPLPSTDAAASASRIETPRTCKHESRLHVLYLPTAVRVDKPTIELNHTRLNIDFTTYKSITKKVVNMTNYINCDFINQYVNMFTLLHRSVFNSTSIASLVP